MIVSIRGLPGSPAQPTGRNASVGQAEVFFLSARGGSCQDELLTSCLGSPKGQSWPKQQLGGRESGYGSIQA